MTAKKKLKTDKKNTTIKETTTMRKNTTTRTSTSKVTSKKTTSKTAPAKEVRPVGARRGRPPKNPETAPKKTRPRAPCALAQTAPSEGQALAQFDGPAYEVKAQTTVAVEASTRPYEVPPIDPIDAYGEAQQQDDQQAPREHVPDPRRSWRRRWFRRLIRRWIKKLCPCKKPVYVSPPPEEWTRAANEVLGIQSPPEPAQEQPKETPVPDPPGGSDLDGNPPAPRSRSKPLPLERDRLEALERFQANLRNRKPH
jgi:hypothetical protein